MDVVCPVPRRDVLCDHNYPYDLARKARSRDMESEMPKLPPIPNRDDRIMSTVQEAFHDHQDGVQRS
jgi:hypothetical protein